MFRFDQKLNFFGLLDGLIHVIYFFLRKITWIDAKVEFFPLIKPYFCQSGIVMVDNFRGTPWEGIWGRFSENMTHVATSGNH